MSKAVSRGQALQVAARVATQVNWDELDGDKLQAELIDLSSEEFGQRFTDFLKNGAKPVFISEPRILKIGKQTFDPAKFIGDGWSVWRGPADGNGLEGEEDIDKRSLAIFELGISKVLFETILKSKESSITGEKKLQRIKKAGHVRLGANVFLALWEDYQKNKENSVLEFLYRSRKVTYLDFFGTILRNPNGNRNVLYLCRGCAGKWSWLCSWLDNDWDTDDLSALLAS